MGVCMCVCLVRLHPNDRYCVGARPFFFLLPPVLDSRGTELQRYLEGHSIESAWLEKTLRLFREGVYS